MSHFIDRRLNGRNKSAVNRQRFIKRYKTQLKRAVADAVNQRSITDIDSGEQVGIPSRDISEPIFHHSQGGTRDMVHPGNRDFMTGDQIQRPEGGGRGGSGQGKAGKGGLGEDEFLFELSREEFMDLLFDDLELPNLVRNQLLGSTEFKTIRAGYRTDGAPSNIDVVRSLKGSIARRTALGGPYRARIRALEEELAALLALGTAADDPRVLALQAEIDRQRTRIAALPFIDTFDLRYQGFVKRPEPTSKAVMVCIMDVSGSMDQARKNLAKRFFILLYLFLKRNYDRIEVVFIRHHTIAQEVDEQEFFYSRETGGTVVSSALDLTYDVLRERYDPGVWNIYAAQASDGDNWDSDSTVCRDLLVTKLLPLMRYFAYVEITPRQHQSLWYAYQEVAAAHRHFVMRQIDGADDIFPVFRDLFKRQVA
ncbi:YeaH/YhbH family protein [uncultured Thiodictyon sp.]|uniref:YeaH/YhbH family protein n=1 Tax=uncultured Thiodictyon sp. TaxID=1846217 RepID=UPI0025ECA1EC|nr:YeaH/YhbH family protein [uncultured Thiodictyon sp.]